MKPPPDAKWRVVATGIAHAFLPRGPLSVCGLERRQPERFDYPWSADTLRCKGCTDELNRLTVDALREPVPVRGPW